jgi:putative transposase
MILKMGEATSNREIARQMRMDRWTVMCWRKRWLKMGPKLEAAQAANVEEKVLKRIIEEALSDEPRSGAPPRFTPEQIVQIVAVACEKPEDSGRPISHWTPRELKEEVVKRKIVQTISVRSVGRFLKSGRS